MPADSRSQRFTNPSMSRTCWLCRLNPSTGWSGNETWTARVTEAQEIGDDSVPSPLASDIFEEMSPSRTSRAPCHCRSGSRSSSHPKYSVDECKERDTTYSAPLYVKAEFMNNNTGEIKSADGVHGRFPAHDRPQGTFIINGTERVVVSQLVRSPGVYFEATADKTMTRTSSPPRSSRRAVPGSSSRSTSVIRWVSASTASASSR